jgi:glycosyltransferase involved in cell wall biosynthesis
VTTSGWTRNRLLDRYPLQPERVHVAHPGAVRGVPAPGTESGGNLLCVAAVAPHKGQDLLLQALAELPDAAWRCTVVGPLDIDAGYVERLRRWVAESPVGDRISCAGPRIGDDLQREYHRADLLVAPSRLEAYGMAVTEALAVGLPVLATAVGGLPEALGRTHLGPPGLLVPPDDPPALAAALAGWLRDAALRRHLRRAALARREALEGWDATTARVAAILAAAGEEAVPAHGLAGP